MVKTTLLILSITALCVIKAGDERPPLAYNLTPTSVLLSPKNSPKIVRQGSRQIVESFSKNNNILFTVTKNDNSSTIKQNKSYFSVSPVELMERKKNHEANKKSTDKEKHISLAERFKTTLQKNPNISYAPKKKSFRQIKITKNKGMSLIVHY